MVIIETNDFINSEPILKTYCELIEVEIINDIDFPKCHKNFLIKIDFEKNAFAVFKPVELFQKGV